MRSKASISPRLPIRRGLSAAEAAIYLSLGLSLFTQMVDKGEMPKPRLAHGRKVWDIDEIDAAFLNLPREGGEVIADSWADFRNGDTAAAIR